MQKFGFSIRTRDGQLIERLNIAGRDQQDAERKLRQMYRHCEIIQCGANRRDVGTQTPQASVDDLLSLIAK